MCPVTCDHALSIEVLSLSLLSQAFVTQSFLCDEPLRTSAWEATCLSFSSKKKVEPATADRRFIGLNRLQAWENNQHFPTFHFQGDVAKCFLWLQLRRPASLWTRLWSSAIFSPNREPVHRLAACQQAVPFWVASEASRERTRERRKVARPFYPPSWLSFPFVCRSLMTFRVTVTIYVHQLKILFAGYNISCNILAINLLAEFGKK